MEPRRIESKPVSDTAPTDEKKKAAKTYRFSLSLTESNSSTYPEFSYSELVKDTLVCIILLPI